MKRNNLRQKLNVIAFFLILISCLVSVHALSTGLKNATATGEDYKNFTNPTDAYTSNNVYATENRNGEIQDYYNFSFNIPVNTTIRGIQVNLEGNDGAAANQGFVVELSWDGGTSYTSTGYNATWPTATDVIRTLGNSTNTWGRTWAYTDFTDAIWSAIK